MNILFKNTLDPYNIPLIIFVENGTKWVFVRQLQRIFKPSCVDSDIISKEFNLEAVKENMRKQKHTEKYINDYAEKIIKHPEEINEDWKRLSYMEIEELKAQFDSINNLFPIINPHGELLVSEAAALWIIMESTNDGNKAFGKKAVKSLLETRDSSRVITSEQFRRLQAWKDCQTKREDCKEATECQGGSDYQLVVESYLEGAYSMTPQALKAFKKIETTENVWDCLNTVELQFNTTGLTHLIRNLYEEREHIISESDLVRIAIRSGKDNRNHHPKLSPEKLPRAENIKNLEKLFYEVFGKKGLTDGKTSGCS